LSVALPCKNLILAEEMGLDTVGTSCAACFNRPEIAKQEVGEVQQERCLFCHSESSRLKRIEETPFLHIKHTSEHKVECFQCHTQIKHAGEEWPL